MFILLKIVIGIAIILLVVGVGRTWQVEQRENQTLFLAGAAPQSPLDGLYRGSVPGQSVSWLGKKFNAADSTGINVFDKEGAQVERYPFKTSVTKGIRDTELDVLAIDYNISGNPFWLRPILDEVVEVEPGKYLGKLHVRLIWGYPFTLGFFELTK